MLYEGLFIFPEILDEEGLDQAIARSKTGNVHVHNADVTQVGPDCRLNRAC